MLVYKNKNQNVTNRQYGNRNLKESNLRLFENNLNDHLYHADIPMFGNVVVLHGADYENRNSIVTITKEQLFHNFKEIFLSKNRPEIQDDWGYETDDECDEKCMCESCKLIEQEDINDEVDECDGDCEHCEFGTEDDEDEELPTEEKYGPYWFEDLIQDVIFNGNATTVIWHDGCKTTVKTMDGDVFDPMAGFALAVTESLFSSKTRFKDYIQKYVDKAARRKPSKRIRKQMEKNEKELKDGGG